jgi:hypothetical protein
MEVDEVGVVAVGPVQVLAPQLEAQLAGEAARAVASPAGSVGSRPSARASRTAAVSSESWVQERRLKLSLPTVHHTSSTTQTFACT